MTGAAGYSGELLLALHLLVVAYGVPTGWQFQVLGEKFMEVFLQQVCVAVLGSMRPDALGYTMVYGIINLISFAGRG
jgi:hypothetical protein